MSWLDELRGVLPASLGAVLPVGSLQSERILSVPSGDNVRELGGYRALGGLTRWHRYLRSGSTDRMDSRDIARLRAYGVTHVLDLRGSFEQPRGTCAFAREKGFTWLNVPLYDFDLHDPRFVPPDGNEDYLVESYLTMLSNHDAVRQVIEFLADVPPDECALFHCAAGMDRTGVTAMLLLAVAGVGRRQIAADYVYSFGSVDEVNQALDDPDFDGNSPWLSLQARLSTMGTVYATLLDAYGSVDDYLMACGVSRETLERLRAGFVEGA